MSKTKKENIILCGLFLLFSILYYFFMFRVSSADHIYYDSTYQYFLMQHNFKEIFYLIPLDYSPPLYSILLKFFCIIFGHTYYVMKFFGLLLIIALFAITLFAGRRILGFKTSIILTIMVFSSSTLLYELVEIRPTILAMVLMVIVGLYAIDVFFNPSLKSYILFTVFSIAAMYTHNISMLSTFGIFVVLLLASLITKQRKTFLGIFFCGIICAISYVPWLFVLFYQINNVLDHYWTTYFSTYFILIWTVEFPYDLYRYDLFDFILPVFNAGVFIIFLRHIDFSKVKVAKKVSEIIKPIINKKEASVTLLAFCFAVTDLLLFILLDNCFYRLASQRYCYIFGMLWTIFFALVISQHMNKIIQAILVILLILNISLAVYSVQINLKESTAMGGIEYIQNSEANEDDIYFLHYHEHSIGIFSYYFPNAHHITCDDTFTVLNTFDVFTTEITDTNDPTDILNYTNHFFIPFYTINQVFNHIGPLINELDSLGVKYEYKVIEDMKFAYVTGETYLYEFRILGTKGDEDNEVN